MSPRTPTPVAAPVRTPSDLAAVFAGCARARGVDPDGFTAWTAWESFADFAAVRMPSAGGLEADALLYQWGTFTRSGGPQFHLVLSRQVAAAKGDLSLVGHEEYLQLDVRLRYDAVPTLTSLGRFESSWVQDGERAASGWVAQVSGRPEWAVLSPLRPLAVEVTSERV